MKKVMLIMFVASILLLSCNNSKDIEKEKKALIGHWEQTGGKEDFNGKAHYIFNEGGDVIRYWSEPDIDTQNGKWHFDDDGQLMINFIVSIPYIYLIENGVLSLKVDGGEEQLFKKVN